MKKRKIRVGIIFGGKSTEHEVSLLSAKNVVAALNREKYEPVLIGIDKTGKWHRSAGANYLLNSENPKLIALNSRVAQEVVLPTGSREVVVREDGSAEPLDVVFPVLHGPLGEDGTVQGLLKLMDIPFVGPSVLGSAIGMDKDVQKRLLRDAGIPIAKFLVLRREGKKYSLSPFSKGETGEGVENVGFSFAQVRKGLGLPFFIKPANAGSSVGVSKVKKETDFKRAIEDAFRYDSKILIEEAIDGREIECAVLGNEDPIASVPGEVKPNHEFYSYEAKYLDDDGAVCEIPAKLPKALFKKVQETAIAAFKTLECEGMARVDMFVTGLGGRARPHTKSKRAMRGKDGSFLENGGREYSTHEDNFGVGVYVNEINTIPGFTKISMYPKLFGASGIPYSKLIDTLIQLALARAKREKRLATNFKL